MTTTSTEQKTTTPKKQTKQSTKIDHLDKAQSTTNPKIENSTISLLVYKDSLEPQLWHVLMGESFEANVRYELWSRKEKKEWETYCDCRPAAKEMKEIRYTDNNSYILLLIVILIYIYIYLGKNLCIII